MGLRCLGVWRKDGILWRKCSNVVPDIHEMVTRRKVFSFCGGFVSMWMVVGSNWCHQVKSKCGNESLGQSNK